jgi:DNA ligase-1
MSQKLYKTDTKGKTRVWWVEHDEEKYRVHSGLLDGKVTVSGWKYPEPKNVGRTNETTVKEQVELEVAALYEKKLNQGNYHDTLEGIKEGPKFVKPMLAIKFDPKKHIDFPYHVQPKLDGIRCLISKDGMFSRQGKPINSCPHIWEDAKSIFAKHPDIVLDGELYNHELKHDFEKIVSLVRKSKPDEEDLAESKRLVEYHVYDVISSVPEIYQNRSMDAYTMTLDCDYIFPVGNVIIDRLGDIEQYMSECLEEGYEGAMVRCSATPYEHKRSKSLMKYKVFDDAEFKVVEILEGEGNWAGVAKAVEILLPDGTTQKSGMRGTLEFAEELWKNQDKMVDSIVTVRYQGLTGDNKLRFPVVIKFWGIERDM